MSTGRGAWTPDAPRSRGDRWLSRWPARWRWVRRVCGGHWCYVLDVPRTLRETVLDAALGGRSRPAARRWERRKDCWYADPVWGPACCEDHGPVRPLVWSHRTNLTYASLYLAIVVTGRCLHPVGPPLRAWVAVCALAALHYATDLVAWMLRWRRR